MQAPNSGRGHELNEPQTELRQASPATLPDSLPDGDGGPAQRLALSPGDGAASHGERISPLVVARGRNDVLREPTGTDCRTLEMSAKAALLESSDPVFL